MLKLQTLSNSQTKRLSFITTFKGHDIITYLNHASTKDVPAQNQCQIWIQVKEYVLCTAEHCSLRSRKPKLYGDIKSRYLRLQQLWKIFLFLSRHIL